LNETATAAENSNSGSACQVHKTDLRALIGFRRGNRLRERTSEGDSKPTEVSPSGRGQLSGERVEHRLAAILAADVAGYSRIMGQDEAGTLARPRTHRRELIDPKIAEHKGAVALLFGGSNHSTGRLWFADCRGCSRS